MQPDPFSQLDEWAAKTERRVRRGHRWARLRAMPRAGMRRLNVGRLGMVLVAVGTVCALWLSRGVWLHWPGSTAAPYPTMLQPSGMYATSGADRAAAGPFAGTPAADFARGKAGFVMPKATRIGKWTAAEVGTALTQVHEALAAIYVDRKALVKHDPAALLVLLAPVLRKEIRKRYADPRRSPPFVLLADHARLSAEPPRVNGRTTIRGKTDRGLPYLEIITNYVVVYAFEAPDMGPNSRTALVHWQITWRYYHTNRIKATERGLRPYKWNGYLFGMDCAAAEKGLLALWRPRALATRTPVAVDNPASYYDPNRSLDVPDDCG